MTHTTKVPINWRPKIKQMALVAVIVALIIAASLGIRFWMWVTAINSGLDALEQGKLTKARQQAQQAIVLMSWFPDNKSFALSLRMMTSIYACRRQFKQAESYCRRLLEFDRKIWGENSPEFAGDLSDLALMKRKQQEFAESEKLYRKVIDIYSLYRDRGAERARYQALLAWVLIQQNKIDEAQHLLDESDKTLQAKFGESHFERLVGVVENAYIQKKIKGANEKFRTGVDTAYKIATEPNELDKSSAQTVVVLNLLGQMLAELGDNERALKIFEIAERNCISSAFGGGYNSFMADILEPHAKLLAKMGRMNESEIMRRRAAQIRSVQLS